MSEAGDKIDKSRAQRTAMNREIGEAVDQMKKIGWGDKFRFRCHKDISCWTNCCHNTNLFLMPYDILRLKKRLGLDSLLFLDTHTKNSIDPATGLPVRNAFDGHKNRRLPFCF